MARRSIGIAMAATLPLLLATVGYAGSGPRTVLTSVGPGDEQVQDSSSTYWRSLSGNGRRALFTADDDDLPGANGTTDVYLRDLESGATRLVSRNSAEEAADDDSGDDPAISGNGRFVAFSSNGENLPGGVGGVFLRDLQKGETNLVSKTTGGEPAIGSSTGRPVLSADGRFVSFEADDDDFPGADGTIDAYVHAHKTGRTSLISQSSSGDPVDTNSASNPAISGNGRFVAFHSDSDVLPGADGTDDLFLRDRKKGKTTLVSKTPAGDPAGGGLGYAGAVSFDGDIVAFEASEASLGADPSGSVFVRDREHGTTKLVSVEGDGGVASGDTASISANGRYVVYESADDDLPGLDGITDVFRYDRRTKQTLLVSRSTGGDPGGDDSFYVSISGGGGFVSFTSRADDFSDADDNAYGNTFVRGPLR